MRVSVSGIKARLQSCVAAAQTRRLNSDAAFWSLAANFSGAETAAENKRGAARTSVAAASLSLANETARC